MARAENVTGKLKELIPRYKVNFRFGRVRRMRLCAYLWVLFRRFPTEAYSHTV